MFQVKRYRFMRAAALGAALAATLPAVAGAQSVSISTTPMPSRIARPDGYIGIVYSGDQRMQGSQHTRNGAVIEQKILVSYAAYPVIVSVEPGSPAERAGLTAGDTVLSYNGKDVVAEPFPLYDMLKPGSRLKLRVKRNGRLRTANVTVGKRPSIASGVPIGTGTLYVTSPQFEEDVKRQVEAAQEQVRRELERNRELSERQREQIRRSAERSATATAVRTVPLTFTTSSITGVGGAEMTLLNEDLSDLVGVRRGVFVVKVNPGTPAEQSGLRGGDVITAVGDSAISDVSHLRRLIAAEQRRVRREKSEQALLLHIVRKHKRQKLTLRW